MHKISVRVFDESEALYEQATNLVVSLGREAVAKRGVFIVTLAGGWHTSATL